MSGQTIADRLTAARYSIAGQGLAKSVCKATTEEAIGPKKKHLDYLLHCTNEPNVSIPHLANLLIERTQYNNWVVVFKALITVHNLMCYGNERFTQYLASSNCNFQLSNFLDKTGVAGQSYDMSTYIRRYAKYLNEKAVSYRGVAFDFCKVKRGKKDGTLRTMSGEELLKTVPVLQAQIDALLEFDCTSNELRNGVINSAFVLLFRDLIRLFACYNDGIINLLEKFFDMNKKQCREALDIYKKFLIRMDRVAEFLKVAENAGIDKGDIPDLTKAPSSLLDALEAHLANLEGKKPPTSSAATSQQQSKVNISSAVTALSSTSTAFGIAANSTRVNEVNGAPIDENLKSQVLAEEEAVMNQYREQHMKTNPFLSSPEHAPSAGEAAVDLFGSSTAPATTQSQPSKASDDLLQLTGNPFSDILGGGGGGTGAPPAAPAPNMWAPQPAAPTQQNGFVGIQPSSHQQSSESFASESSFAAAFGAPATSQSIFGMTPTMNIMNSAPPPEGGGESGAPVPNPNLESSPKKPPVSSSALDGLDPFGFGDSATPAASGPSQTPQKQPVATTGFDAFGDILQPQGAGAKPAAAAGAIPQASPAHRGAQPQPAAPAKILTGDLESSLASLADNLTMKGSGAKGSSMWGSPKNTAKTGGPQFSQPTSAAPMRPVGGMAGGGQPGFFNAPQGSNPMQPRPTGMQTGGMMMGAPVSTSNTQLDPFGAL